MYQNRTDCISFTAEAWNHQVWILKCYEKFSSSLKNASTFLSGATRFLKECCLKVTRFCLFVLLRTASMWWVWRTGEVLLLGKLQLKLKLCFIVVFIFIWLPTSLVFKLFRRHIFFIMKLVNIILVPPPPLFSRLHAWKALGIFSA